MRKVNKEELNIKNTWIVTELLHERYTFDIKTLIYKDKTVLEILDDLVYWGLENKLEKYENSNTYIIDEIYHEDKDSEMKQILIKYPKMAEHIMKYCQLFGEYADIGHIWKTL